MGGAGGNITEAMAEEMHVIAGTMPGNPDSMPNPNEQEERDQKLHALCKFFMDDGDSMAKLEADSGLEFATYLPALAERLDEARKDNAGCLI